MATLVFRSKLVPLARLRPRQTQPQDLTTLFAVAVAVAVAVALAFAVAIALAFAFVPLLSSRSAAEGSAFAFAIAPFFGCHPSAQREDLLLAFPSITRRKSPSTFRSTTQKKCAAHS
ncbi:MAG TPA: hypothetical protein VHW70_12350 [Edaphobacter sp.]|nr:hypothetical protein [Edaphobacter sp.]